MNRTKQEKITENIITINERNDFENYLKLIKYLTQRRNQSTESITYDKIYCNNEIIPNLKEEEKLKRLLEVIIKVQMEKYLLN